MICLLVAGLYAEGSASTPTNEAHPLTLSDMQAKITSQGHTATFRLYDTVAAKNNYDQLPLTLELTHIRDAQWMFYSPAKLGVTGRGAYHDGKKGELSYYAPGAMWSCSMAVSALRQGCIRWDMPCREASTYRGCPVPYGLKRVLCHRFSSITQMSV
jgi:hypothetical protein